MRMIVLTMCALVATCVFAAMFFAIWCSHRHAPIAGVHSF